MDDFEAATARFLAVGPKAPQPLPGDVTTATLQIPAPPHWPDGPQVAARVHRRGDGPAALLVHGWRSQAAELDAPAAMLVAAGFTVWMPDLPGHGHSEGGHLSIPLAAATLRAVQALAGPFAFAVAHSYGAACLVQALADGLAADRVALLAAPTHYGQFARRAALQAGMPQAALPRWLAHLGRTIGADPDLIDMKRQARGLSMPALLAHSRDDPVVPFEALAEVAACWRGATWLPLDGLGHFRLLTDAGLLRRLRAFATGAAAA